MKKCKSIIALFLFMMLLCASLIYVMPVTSIFADEDSIELAKDENGIYNIDSAEKLLAFASLVEKTEVSNPSEIKAKLTADINLNQEVTFSYDAATGLVTVSKNGVSYKMGTGLKNTELGSFHPVYNGLCTQEEWDNEEITSEERRTELINEMNNKVEALNLRKWKPIGTSIKPFVGFFDGNGHTIDGLYINDSSIGYVGLFGVKGKSASINLGEISNLTIGENSLIVGYKAERNGATGAITGKLEFDEITDCTTKAIVVGKGSTAVSGASNGLVGGIAGFINGTVDGCSNYGTVVSFESAGGIVGNIMGNTNDRGSVSHSTNYGHVYADTESGIGCAGGIAVNAGGSGGSADVAGEIKSCMNYGYVEGSLAGGIMYRVANSAVVKYCANRGTVAASSSSAGIVEYIDKRDVTIEGCYNAGNVSLLAVDEENVSTLRRITYPIVCRVYTSLNRATTHSVKNCYNDKKVCPVDDDKLFGENIESSNCNNVTTEFFATGEPAYKMGSWRSQGWRQKLPTPKEVGKTPENYPTTEGEYIVNYNTHYCCHKDAKNKEAHKEYFFTNSSTDVTDEHVPNENGICSHCGANVSLPKFSEETLREAKVGKRYDVTINLVNETTANSNIKAVISETDDSEYIFSNGLTGKADYSGYKGYYYYISGVPTEAGTLTFTLIAENDNGVTKKTYTLKINEADPLEIATESKLDKAKVGEGYWLKFTCSTDFVATWSVADGSSLPEGLVLHEDGSISGTPEKAGKYTFTIVVTAGGMTASKTFTLRVQEENCIHENMKLFEGKKATCKEEGVADYYYCEDCECYFADKVGNIELSNIDNLKTVSNHSDKNNDGKCDFCNRNMPEFKRVTNKEDIVYGSTYILVTKIDGKYYALTIPTNIESGTYNNLMVLCEITAKPNGNFTFNALETKGVMMLKTEFAVENGNLDAGMLRFGLSTIINNVRYGLNSDSNESFWMYKNEPAKYGYRITLNESGEILIGSVYQEWWNKPENAENGLLRAFNMTSKDKNVKFMSFASQSSYVKEYSDATINNYPIYLYQMVNVGYLPGDIPFTSNDTTSNVSSGNCDLPDIIDISNVNGLAEAVDEEYLENLIEEKASGKTDASAGLYAEITAKNVEKDDDKNTIVSIKYSVVPMITLFDKDGKVLYQGVISDSNLNGSSITVTLYAGEVAPEQVIHHKEDGTKEYFYAEGSEKAKNGVKTFKYEDGFVTFIIDSFSDIEILATAKAEEINEPKNDTPKDSNTFPTIAIVGIVVGSVVIVGISAFAIVWFVIKKKTFADLTSVFKRKK